MGPELFINSKYLPSGITLREPSKMKAVEVDGILDHWYMRRQLDSNDVFKFSHFRTADDTLVPAISPSDRQRYKPLHPQEDDDSSDDSGPTSPIKRPAKRGAKATDGKNQQRKKAKGKKQAKGGKKEKGKGKAPPPESSDEGEAFNFDEIDVDSDSPSVPLSKIGPPKKVSGAGPSGSARPSLLISKDNGIGKGAAEHTDTGVGQGSESKSTLVDGQVISKKTIEGQDMVISSTSKVDYSSAELIIAMTAGQGTGSDEKTVKEEGAIGSVVIQPAEPVKQPPPAEEAAPVADNPAPAAAATGRPRPRPKGKGAAGAVPPTSYDGSRQTRTRSEYMKSLMESNPRRSTRTTTKPTQPDTDPKPKARSRSRK